MRPLQRYVGPILPLSYRYRRGRKYDREAQYKQAVTRIVSRPCHKSYF